MIFWQYLLPKHLLSTVVHRLALVRIKWFKNGLIRYFIKQYQVNLSEAKLDKIEDYKHFNAFFTRALKTQVRTISTEAIVSPADGKISQLGNIQQGDIFTAKAKSYSLVQLLGEPQKAADFSGGHYLTIYLSPKDYHRVHAPCDSHLMSMAYVPGTLFSVNATSTKSLPTLLAKNERIICYFDSNFGQVAVVLIGAIFVGSMQTVWQGKITPPYGKSSKHWDYSLANIYLKKAEELGRFNMGSTVIVIFTKQASNLFKKVVPEQIVRIGQALVLFCCLYFNHFDQLNAVLSNLHDLK